MKFQNIIPLFQLIIIILSIVSSYNYCEDVKKPILLSSTNTCVLQYCTQEEFDNNICIKDNQIIKTQWLNNIITLGVENGRLTKTAKYKNGDMLAFSVKHPGEALYPYFYGLKENGRPLFIKEDKETPFNHIEYYSNFYNPNGGMSSYFTYDEGEIFMTKMLQNEEEYLMYFGSQRNKCTELYDFDDNDLLFRLTNMVFSNCELTSYRGSVFNLKDSDYFLYAGIFICYSGWSSSSNSYLILHSLGLNTKESLSSINSNNLIQKSSDKIQVSGKMISCFQVGSKHIVCFYIFSLNEKKYKIINYDENLSKKNFEETITSNVINENIFFKGIHYEAETGIFIYYKYIDRKGPFPIISFIDRKRDKFEKKAYLGEIILNNYAFNTSLFLNDFIKISKDVVCLASVSPTKDILYIVRLNIFNDKTNVKIRY